MIQTLPAASTRFTTCSADVDQQLSTSRQVQCITLKHIASIDRKTGGTLSPDAQAGDPPPAGCRDVTP